MFDPEDRRPPHERSPADSPAALDAALRRRDHRAAAHALVNHFADEVYRFCVHAARSRQDGEDLAQEILGEACRSLPRFRGRSSVRTWLYRIAWHKVLDHRRRHARQPQLVPIEGAAGHDALRADGDPHQALAALHRRRHLERAYQRLSVEDRMVLALRIDLELPFADVARVLGVRIGAAKMRMNRAVERLRTEVER